MTPFAQKLRVCPPCKDGQHDECQGDFTAFCTCREGRCAVPFAAKRTTVTSPNEDSSGEGQ